MSSGLSGLVRQALALVKTLVPNSKGGICAEALCNSCYVLDLIESRVLKMRITRKYITKTIATHEY